MINRSIGEHEMLLSKGNNSCWFDFFLLPIRSQRLCFSVKYLKQNCCNRNGIGKKSVRKVEGGRTGPSGWLIEVGAWKDRWRGVSFIIYDDRENIKFSDCKIDAAYVTSSSFIPRSLSLYPSIEDGSCVIRLVGVRGRATGSRGVPCSFYCKATPHIVQGRVIHFLPDSAQLFINCCSLGKDRGNLSSFLPPPPPPPYPGPRVVSPSG